MMRLLLVSTVVFFVAAVSAFQPALRVTRTSSSKTALFGENAIRAAQEAEAIYGPESPQAKLAWRTAHKIQTAFQASEQFGPTSPEARVAWDNVEEVQAAGNDNQVSNSNANLGLNLNNMLTPEELQAMTARYQDNVDRVQLLKDLSNQYASNQQQQHEGYDENNYYNQQQEEECDENNYHSYNEQQQEESDPSNSNMY